MDTTISHQPSAILLLYLKRFVLGTVSGEVGIFEVLHEGESHRVYEG